MELIETVRVERGRVVLLPYHYRRLKRGALELGIPLKISKGEFEELLIWKWKEEGKGVKLVRFSVGEDGKFSLSARECEKRERVRLKSVYSVKRSFSALSPHKTREGAEFSKVALKEAQRAGWDEAITYCPEGFISECAFANIFFVKDGLLFTPSLKTGCLRGTRREFIIEIAREIGIPIREGFFETKELLTADEVFITSSREDACPVAEIDGYKIATRGKPFSSRVREVVEWMEFKAKGLPFGSQKED